MHQPYEQRLGHQADFRVKYRFYKPEEGGRKTLPYHSDFWYEYADSDENKIHIIWPEFENENGQVILDDDKSVPESGTARMWIMIPERRKIHRERVKIGTKGYFKEGSRSTGECEVIEILGLPTNPTQIKK